VVGEDSGAEEELGDWNESLDDEASSVLVAGDVDVAAMVVAIGEVVAP